MATESEREIVSGTTHSILGRIKAVVLPSWVCTRKVATPAPDGLTLTELGDVFRQLHFAVSDPEGGGDQAGQPGSFRFSRPNPGPVSLLLEMDLGLDGIAEGSARLTEQAGGQRLVEATFVADRYACRWAVAMTGLVVAAPIVLLRERAPGMEFLGLGVLGFFMLLGGLRSFLNVAADRTKERFAAELEKALYQSGRVSGVSA